MSKTSIEWADSTWNPITGCTKVSPGCTNCFAERMAKRQVAMGFARHERGSDNDATWIAYSNAIDPDTGKWSGEITCRPEKLDEPLHWRKPRRIFVSSMSDLFHEDVSFEFISKVFATMIAADWHTFLILTKRPKRMLSFMSWFQTKTSLILRSFRHIWLGVTAENQEWWDRRRDAFFACPATLHFVSYEPALGPLTFSNDDLERLMLVIVGGETGPDARPMQLQWARDIEDQCRSAGVAFFFKQAIIRGKRIHTLDGIEYKEFPNVQRLPLQQNDILSKEKTC